eukprot:4359669-Pleurochrysis_carterae.AAC.1
MRALTEATPAASIACTYSGCICDVGVATDGEVEWPVDKALAEAASGTGRHHDVDGCASQDCEMDGWT